MAAPPNRRPEKASPSTPPRPSARTAGTFELRARRPFRVLGIIALTIILLGGWIYLYLLARQVDLTAQNEIRVHLAHLRSIDNRWNDRLINLRNSQIATRDSDFVSPITPTTLALTQHELAVRAQILANPAINQTLVELKTAFNAKIQSVDRFGLAHRALAESFTAFNAAAEAAGPRDRSVLRLVAAVNALVAQPNPDTRRGVDEAIAGMESERRGNEVVVRRGREIAETRTIEEDAFREAIFASAVGQRIETLSRAIDHEFQRVLDDGERYRVLLLFYSAILLALASILAVRLFSSFRLIRRINQKLREANDSLEKRVSERTQELEQALGQLKQHEAMLIQSEKMSSLGQMVAGVAHEVNTPLAYVKGSLESVGKQLPRLENAHAESVRLLDLLRAENASEADLARQFAAVSGLLDDISANHVMQDLRGLVGDGLYGITQIGELVQNLRDFSRLDRSKLDQFDLNEGAASALAITKAAIRARTVRREFGKIPRISCSPSQINQVLLNLLNNAAQATPDDPNGVITVRTGMRGADDVFIDVEDNGHGIPEDVLPKIFDPFFTTKEIGKGTGLGLAIVYKIVEQHGGRVTVASKAGVGSRFTVILPVRADRIDRPVAPALAPA